MERKLVGQVTMDERNEILTLYERQAGIEELMPTLSNCLLSKEQQEKLLEKIPKETEKVNTDIALWWENIRDKYQLEFLAGHDWHLDFETCEIYLE